MFLFSALPTIIIGVSALIALRVMYGNQRSAADDLLVLAITIAAWVMIFLGFAMMVTPFGMLIVLLIFAMTVAKYREGERRSLMWALAIAAEKGLPLAPSARAFAARRCDEMARRAWVLADYLDAGTPLYAALQKSGNPLPIDATVMVRLGDDPRTTARALREAAEHGGQAEDAWRPIFEQTMYLLNVIFVCIFITAFIMINIIPTYEAIFSDFGVAMPPASMFMIEAANLGARNWFWFLPFLMYLVVVFLVAGFYYACGQFWIPWPFSKIFGSTDNPTVLRALAVCVEQGLPMDQALSRLSNFYPRKDVAAKLANASGTTAVGKDWCTSLRDEQIITEAESAVLKSAARTGNLVWAIA